MSESQIIENLKQGLVEETEARKRAERRVTEQEAHIRELTAERDASQANETVLAEANKPLLALKYEHEAQIKAAEQLLLRLHGSLLLTDAPDYQESPLVAEVDGFFSGQLEKKWLEHVLEVAEETP